VIADPREEEIKEGTDKRFADHKIRRTGPGSWECSKRGAQSWIDWFGVLLAPRLVVVHGDIGDLMMSPYEANPFKWATTALGLDYALGKAKLTSCGVREYSPAVAKATLASYYNHEYCCGEEEGSSLRCLRPQELAEAWETHEDEEGAWGQTHWIEAQADTGWAEDGDVCLGEQWTREALICFYALRWWADKLSADGNPKPEWAAA